MSKVETIYLKDYKAPEFTIKTCDLVFELFEEGSLTYVGGDKLSEYVGGYDAIVLRSELAEIHDGI